MFLDTDLVAGILAVLLRAGSVLGEHGDAGNGDEAVHRLNRTLRRTRAGWIRCVVVLEILYALTAESAKKFVQRHLVSPMAAEVFGCFFSV